MRGWLSESIPEVLSGGFLVGLQAKGVSADELAGMARVLQSQSLGWDGSPVPRRSLHRHLRHRGGWFPHL